MLDSTKMKISEDSAAFATKGFFSLTEVLSERPGTDSKKIWVAILREITKLQFFRSPPYLFAKTTTTQNIQNT